LSKQQKDWLKRRSAIESAIGHLKSDHRMDRCWLQVALGDTLHSISCAAGYNLRWLIRAITRLGIRVVFLHLLLATFTVEHAIGAAYGTLACTWINRMNNWLINGKNRNSSLGYVV
jgi:hypothetical protein